MAWQLHYTSARRGPTGRAGFQFVAETPGLPEGARAGVTPYLSYRPPPDAPLSPDDAEVDRFPVALLYDRVAGRPLLLRCRYLGRDYSGRYGNFFAHAVVAEEEELEGLRPAELWHAPLWTDRPLDGGGAAGAELPVLDELSPGADSDPESLARWLAEHGTAGNGNGDGAGGAYALLARLMDAVAGVLARGHGRVVLIAEDVEPIARWIAVVSYSLPVAAAARMSFVTYSADPDGAAQRLVGTTPDVWASAQRLTEHAFHVGGLGFQDGPPVSRFARTVAACWRDFDFAGLDALGELGELAPPGARAAPEVLDRAAALLSLCRGDLTVTPEEQVAVADLLTRRGGEVPGWVWRELAQGAPAMGLDLALAVHGRARDAGPAAPEGAPATGGAGERAADAGPGPAITAALAAAPDLGEVARIAAAASGAGVAADPGGVRAAAERCARGGAADLPAALGRVPAGLRGPLVDGVLDGLAAAGREARRAVLTGAACDLLYEEDPGRLRALPEVALPVLVSVGGRRPERRAAVTGELLRLAAARPETAGSVDRALDRVWKAPPTADGCLALLEAHGEAFAAHGVLAALPARTFARLAYGAGADADAGPGDAREGDGALSAPATLRLAARVRATLPGDGESARAAAAIQAYTDAVTAERPEPAAAALGALASSGAPPRLAEELLAAAAHRLTRRGPRFRAALLAELAGPVRSRLGALWTAALPGRARSGRSPVRGEEIARRNELFEVVLRLRRRGVAEPALETWARAAAGRWLSARQLDAHFAGDRDLRAALKDLIAEARGRGE
ncbi:hypothetical protein ACQP1W_39540 [Spirillospora sp. CA-255316]